MRAGLGYSVRSLLLLTAIVGTTLSLLEALGHPEGATGERAKVLAQKVQQFLADEETDNDEAARAIFELGGGAAPALVAVLREGKSVARASRGLAYLGGPEERAVLLKAIEAEKDNERRSELSTLLAGSLVEPASKEEWAFLENCVHGRQEKGTDDEELVPFSATLALGMNGSELALQLLEGAAAARKSSKKDRDLVKMMARAIYWIKHRSISEEVPLGARSDSEEITKTVLHSAFYAEGQPEIQKVLFTKDKSRALVSIQIYRGPRAAQGYDLALQKGAATWRIVGIWFTWVA